MISYEEISSLADTTEGKEKLMELILNNDWDLNEQDEMFVAAMFGMTQDEYEEYKRREKQTTKNAFADLCGLLPEAETLYEDTIMNFVGKKFLTLFRRYHLIESCAVIDGCKLYALCKETARELCKEN